MITKVQKWGNSLGVRIPKPFAKESHIETGDHVDIEIENEILTIKPVKPSYNLKDLVTKINKGNIHDEVTTGNPIGEEIW